MGTAKEDEKKKQQKKERTAKIEKFKRKVPKKVQEDKDTETELTPPALTPPARAGLKFNYEPSSPESRTPTAKLRPFHYLTKDAPTVERSPVSSIKSSHYDSAEDSSDCLAQKILDHQKPNRSTMTAVKVLYKSGKKEWLPIGFLWHDNPTLVQEYAKKNKLKTIDWKKAKKPGYDLLFVKNMRENDGKKEVYVLWDNRFLSWEPYDAVCEDNLEIVK